MLKPQITVFLFVVFMINLVSEISLAQLKPAVAPAKKAWKRPVTYIMPTPRVKPKKFVYQIETRQVTRAVHGTLLPSQVGINTRSASSDDSAVSLREKPKVEVKPQRSIASE